MAFKAGGQTTALITLPNALNCRSTRELVGDSGDFLTLFGTADPELLAHEGKTFMDRGTCRTVDVYQRHPATASDVPISTNRTLLITDPENRTLLITDPENLGKIGEILITTDYQNTAIPPCSPLLSQQVGSYL